MQVSAVLCSGVHYSSMTQDRASEDWSGQSGAVQDGMAERSGAERSRAEQSRWHHSPAWSTGGGAAGLSIEVSEFGRRLEYLKKVVQRGSPTGNSFEMIIRKLKGRVSNHDEVMTEALEAQLLDSFSVPSTRLWIHSLV